MENTTNNPLPNSVPPTDIEQQHKNIQAELNALLTHQAEVNTPPAVVSEPVKESVHGEVTPAFSGMPSPVHVVPSKPVASSFIPMSPVPEPIKEVVHEESTPAFSGITTPSHTTPAHIPTYVPVTPHVSKVEFSPEDTFTSSKPFIPETVQKSSHTMLWIIIFLSAVFLALLGGAAYWYLKIYSPQNMIEDTASTTTATKEPVAAAPKAFAVPTRSKDVPSQATTKPQSVKTPEVKAYNMSDKEKVSEYIKSHINSLSPKKSSSKFTVTDITFDGPDRAVVSYKNSRSAYSAVAVSYIDSKGNVKITSFTILEK